VIGRITAELSTPLLVDHDLNLDGMLVFVQALALDLPQPTRQTPLVQIPQIPIPLDHIEHAGHRVYLSTSAVYDGPTTYRTKWTRRRDATDIESMDGAFNPGMGPGRNMMVIAHGVRTSRASWFVSTPELDAVMALLADVRELGKVRRHGYGVVREWTCTGCPYLTPRDMLVHGGRAIRSLPLDWLSSWEEGAVRHLAVGLPRWHPEAQIQGVAAGARVELRQEVLA
jgi:hypothetical protein